MLQQNKKGVSEVIGYVILISFAIILGGIVFTWLKSYVPQEKLECPSEVSIFIKDVSCVIDEGEYKINLTLKNNGKFDIAGYFIRGTDSLEQETATNDLSEFLDAQTNIKKIGSAVVFISTTDNSFSVNNEMTNKFTLNENMYSVEIIPVRWQKIGKENRFVTCSNAKVKQVVNCV